MHIPIKWKILLSLLLSLLIVIVVGYTSYYSISANNTSSEQTTTSRKITEHLQNLLLFVVDAETCERGFTLTGDTTYLEPFDKAIKNISAEKSALYRAKDSIAFPREELAGLDSLISLRVSELDKTIKGKRNAVLTSDFTNTVYRDRGKTLMDDVRIRIGIMQKAEQRRTEYYYGLAQKSARLSMLIVPLCTLSSLVILFVAGIIFSRGQKSRNITEESLRKSNEDLNTSLVSNSDIYNNAPRGYHSVNAEGTIIKMNDTELRWLGYERSEVEGKLKIQDILSEGERALYRGRLAEFIATGILHDTEFDITRNDGSVFTASLSSIAEYGKDNEFLYSNTTMIDLTKSKFAENQILEYIDSAPDAVITVNILGEIVRVNKQAETLFGYERNELFGKKVEMLMPVDFRETHMNHRSGYAENVEYKQMGAGLELSGVRKNGSTFPAEISLSPIRAEKETYVSAAIRDITYSKKIEENLRILNRLLESSNNELESFSYSVSHDLRAPLRHIIGFGQKLLNHEQNSGNPESMRLVNKMNGAAAKMSRLIDDLLGLSKVGKIELIKTKIDMNSLFEDIIKETVGDEYRGKITWKIAPLMNAHADLIQIKQLVTNLISNAVKYSSKKEEIVIEIGNTMTDGECIYFIKDNGAGFDGLYKTKLFGVFQRLHREDEFPGTGIGLAIVQRIILRHGGRTWAEGEIDHGATFFFSLPLNNEPLTK